MSRALSDEAWQTTLPGTSKLVLLALCDFANDHRECFPSVRTLATKCGLTTRCVQRQLADLESCHMLERISRSGRATIYRIGNLGNPRTSFTPEPGSPLNVVHHGDEPGSPPPPNVVHHTPERRSPRISKRTIERAAQSPLSCPEPRSPRGGRIPPGWHPDEKLTAWARDRRPDLDLARTTEAFSSYWQAKAGRDALKADWDAAFRNWVLRESATPRPASTAGRLAV